MTDRRYGSDVVVEFLAASGIDHVALNPGASFRALHDSLAAAGSPEIIATLHEEVAVGIAHGYAKSAGRPMAVFVHDQVGLQHASMAIFNAWVDSVPIVLIGGTGPRDTTQRRPWIDWIHSGYPESAAVRDIVKWDAEPASLAALDEALERALQIATTPPMGPVYLAVDALLQDAEAPARGERVAPVAPPPVTAPAATVRELAEALAAAERPVFLVDRGAPGLSAPLLSLAEQLAAAVVDLGGRSFPSDHWADRTAGWAEVLGAADLVVAIEMRDVAWGITHVDVRDRSTRDLIGAGTRLVAVGLAELKQRGFMQLEGLVPRAERITAEPATFARDLVAAVAGVARDEQRIATRRQELESAHRAERLADREAAAASAARTPIEPAHLAATLGRAIAGYDWQLANGLAGGWPRRLWDFRDEASYLGRSGGEGLGYGLPASLGAALAQRGTGRLVVDIQADGDLMYTPEALWTAAHHSLPLLIVVHNNRTYGKDEIHQEEVARARGRDYTAPPAGIRIDAPAIDFAGLARSQGVEAEGPVSDPAELESVLTRLAGVVANEQRPVLVDVVCG